MRRRTRGHRGVALFGASGHARSVASALEGLGITVAFAVASQASGDWDRLIADDAEAVREAAVSSLPAVLGIGDNRRRADVNAALVAGGVDVHPVIARTATCASNATLGRGVVVLEHAHVGPGVRIGAAAIVNTAAIVEHDALVLEAAHVAPGAVLLGGATAGRFSLIGSRAVVLPGIRVGDGATVGAGAVVREDVSPGATVLGVPARKLR